MREEYLKIIDNYGVNNQQRKLAEETWELQEAILEFEHDDYTYYPEVEKSLKEHITEEIADVMNLLEEFIEHYNIDRFDIAKIMEQKVKRTLERMENDNNKN